MRNRVNKFVVKSFTNESNQTINPGDPVLYVGTGKYPPVTVGFGVFEGVYIGKKYHGNAESIVAVRVGNILHYTDYDTGKKVYRKAVLPRMRVYKISK